MEDIKNRQRKVDLEQMDNESVDAISAKIGKKVEVILKKALNDCNSILNIYGLKIEFGYQIQQIKDK